MGRAGAAARVKRREREEHKRRSPFVVAIRTAALAPSPLAPHRPARARVVAPPSPPVRSPHRRRGSLRHRSSPPPLPPARSASGRRFAPPRRLARPASARPQFAPPPSARRGRPPATSEVHSRLSPVRSADAPDEAPPPAAGMLHHPSTARSAPPPAVAPLTASLSERMRKREPDGRDWVEELVRQVGSGSFFILFC